MVKQVRFNPRVKVRAGSQDMNSISLMGLSAESDAEIVANESLTISLGVIIGLILLSLAVFGVWLAGLIRMGVCSGSHTGYFWATLLLFVLIPGPGTIAGFIMSIVALAMLKPGCTALGMSCPK